MENKTLAHVVASSNFQPESAQQGQTVGFTTYLTLYAINLAYRFPDVTDLNKIPYEGVRGIAEFCIASSEIGLEAWENFIKPVPSQSRRNLSAARSG